MDASIFVELECTHVPLPPGVLPETLVTGWAVERMSEEELLALQLHIRAHLQQLRSREAYRRIAPKSVGTESRGVDKSERRSPQGIPKEGQRRGSRARPADQRLPSDQ